MNIYIFILILKIIVIFNCKNITGLFKFDISKYINICNFK